MTAPATSIRAVSAIGLVVLIGLLLASPVVAQDETPTPIPTPTPSGVIVDSFIINYNTDEQLERPEVLYNGDAGWLSPMCEYEWEVSQGRLWPNLGGLTFHMPTIRVESGFGKTVAFVSGASTCGDDCNATLMYIPMPYPDTQLTRVQFITRIFHAGTYVDVYIAAQGRDGHLIWGWYGLTTARLSWTLVGETSMDLWDVQGVYILLRYRGYLDYGFGGEWDDLTVHYNYVLPPPPTATPVVTPTETLTPTPDIKQTPTPTMEPPTWEPQDTPTMSLPTQGPLPTSTECPGGFACGDPLILPGWPTSIGTPGTIVPPSEPTWPTSDGPSPTPPFYSSITPGPSPTWDYDSAVQTYGPGVTPQVVIVVVPPEPTDTPAPDMPQPGSPPGYVVVRDNVDYRVEGVGGLVMSEYDFGCPINVNSELTGVVRLCIRYIYIQAIEVLGQAVPLWPFAGALVLVVVTFVIRR